MNINYNVLWIDDSDDFIESTIELIEETIAANQMVNNIKTYNGFDQFRKCELDNFDVDIFNLYDQILIDYALSGSTGDEIIKEIRARNIFTDIIFYSSNYETMLQEMQNKGQLDGVFFSKREDLTSAVNNVIKKNLKREYNIANIRGIIMDGTSEFDFICRTVSIALFDKLEPSKQKQILDKTAEFVKNAEDKSRGNFKGLSDLLQKNGKKFLKEAIFSVDYVMDNKDRYALMSLIVRQFKFGAEFNDNFAQEYYDKLIKPRNDLAHNKLYYGDCKKKLHIAKKREQSACQYPCTECVSKYDIAQCEKIRSYIYNYFLMLSNLNKNIDD